MQDKDLDLVHDSFNDWIVDSKEVIREVEKYRLDNRPPRTTIVLLAESHSHTTREEFRTFLKDDFRHNDGTRCRHVNFVYCIGNSESLALENEPPTIRRTSQYWRIFYSCLNPVSQNSDFRSFEGGDSNERIERKKKLLLELRNKGIWLLDSSMIAINMLDSKTRQRIIKMCWEVKLQSLFEQLKSEGLLCVMTIGATVYETLHHFLDKMDLDVLKLDHPQARLEGGYWTNFNLIHKTCQKYGIK